MTRRRKIPVWHRRLRNSTTSLPHIVILATGGTIAGTAANNTQTAGYKSGELGVQTLIN
ncbi:hypothetical protein MJM95_29840, partial [Salmonella enterica subsp. enterica serovar Anatum]|nr:hypothetical protein [Salmonella enterica subsp. enterica serovar Anatum]